MPTGTKPFLTFNRITISATYTLEPQKSLDFEFDAVIILTPRNLDAGYAAQLEVKIAYASPTWSFEGRISNLNGACLYSLCPPSDSHALMNVLEDITIVELDVEYTYGGPTNSSIHATGTLKLDILTLDVTFDSGPSAGSGDGSGGGSKDGKDWSFSADLVTDWPGGVVTLGSFLAGPYKAILDDLPDFISMISFHVPDQSTAKTPSNISVRCEKYEGTLVFSILVRLGEFDFDFVQITDAASTTPTKPKRMLRFELEALPEVSKVPLLANLTQPFDQMDLIWVSDDFTKSEIDLLNANIFTDGPKAALVCKAPVTPSATPNNDVMLAKGCHFMIIADENGAPTAVLDYLFGDTPLTKTYDNLNKGGKSFVFATAKALPTPAANPPAPVDGAATSPWSKTLGPLTISSIGLKYEKDAQKNNKLQLTLNATVKLAGVEVSLKGFGIRFTVHTGKNSGFHFDISDIQILLSGLGFSFNEPPLMIAGAMEKTKDGFVGGIAVQFEPYSFLAEGAYTVVRDTATNESFKSIFLILSMAGPIAELEFASLDGLTGGYGYNSALRLPTVTEVTSHPFINTGAIPSPTTDVVATLMTLESGPKPWFTPTKGPMWVAAGLDVAAFEMLNIQAVLVLDISSPSFVIIDIFADCSATVPPDVPAAERMAFVEMGLIASLDIAHGTFTCQGQLTPKSFILDPNCHLTGGFALSYWFAPSAHAGDWAFSIGGYHSAFSPPPWYPVPARLAISWTFDSTISITGEAYFAITPKVAMGGGRLALTYASGSIAAHFTAWADFLINYRPFMFQASMGVDVGATYTFNHADIVKKWEIDVSATVDLHGPPVAGKARVKWHCVHFTVHFGPLPPANGPLGWDAFTGC